MQQIPRYFQKNSMDQSTLFKTLDINSWEDFDGKVGVLDQYISCAHAFHISPNDGLGIRVPKGSEEGRQWGDGSGPDLTSDETYRKILVNARNAGKPVAVEVDYALPVTYEEAFPFLKRVTDLL